MAYKTLAPRWRYRHCSEIGVAADYCILQFQYKDAGWKTVATCHPAAVAVLKAEGVKARADLIKITPGAA